MPSATQSMPLTIYYLEMLERSQLRPKVGPAEFQISEVELPCPEFNRFLYCAVGWQWFWTDKVKWTYEQWDAQVTRPEFRTWVGYYRGTPAGYYELEQQANGDIEIAYFGLFPQFIGRGLGGALLSSAIESAWNWEAKRVWVHTCSLDHPSALANYRARGLKVYKEERGHKTLPLRAQRDWPA